MKSISILFAAVFALLLPAGFTAAHADMGTGGHCTGMTVTDYFTSYASDTSSSTTFLDVTDGHVSFRTSATGCVVIMLTALVAVVPNAGGSYEHLHVRMLLDGESICEPSAFNDITLGAVNPAPALATSISHVCKNVPAGLHSVQVQYRGDSGAPVQISNHTLAVTHN